jgi:hypothetical protein
MRQAKARDHSSAGEQEEEVARRRYRPIFASLPSFLISPLLASHLRA